MRIMPVELNRRRFTVDDYQRMGTAGILSDDDRMELIAGEIRDIKSRVYARAELVEYWLVDLTQDTVFVHSAPRAGEYRSLVRYQRGQSIPPQALPDSVIALEMLLA